MPAIRETTPAALSRLAQFLNGLDELALETGIRVGFGTELVDLRSEVTLEPEEPPSNATFDLAVDPVVAGGQALGEKIVRHRVRWGR